MNHYPIMFLSHHQVLPFSLWILNAQVISSVTFAAFFVVVTTIPEKNVQSTLLEISSLF